MNDRTPKTGTRSAARRRYLSRLLWPAGIVIVLIGLSLTMTISPSTVAEPVTAPVSQGLPVEAVVVQKGILARELTAVGTLQSNESVLITAETAGRVTKIEFTEGTKVGADKVLLRLEPSVLAAERDRAQASLGLSEANHRRAEILLAENAISRRERDEALAQFSLDQANLRLAEAQLAKMTIRAPFSGVIGLRQVSLGGYLRPGDAIATLEQIDPIKVDFRVPESYAGQVRVGQPIRLSVDAVPGRSFDGEIFAIDPQIDANGRSLLLRGRVTNAGDQLRPGMFGRLALVLEKPAEVLMIPEQALVPAGERQLVYKVVDGMVEEAPVETGQRQKGEVEIIAGLQAGETVITAGQLKVRPGMPVTVLPAPKGE
ncbi:MAG: efflux RND transporter periplasmic adaptor subunit [Desulfuromonadales bacterium]|nr:efflux RND transporter periplasmic adaptor subunit [Desulfuromonadales bacterium]